MSSKSNMLLQCAALPRSCILILSLQKMMKFHHIIYWGNFGETDTFPIISQRGNGNFRFPSIFHRNLSISLEFPPKNYGEILTFFAVKDVLKPVLKREFDSFS